MGVSTSFRCSAPKTSPAVQLLSTLRGYAAGPFSLSNYQSPILPLQFFLTLIRTAIQLAYVAIEIRTQRTPSQVNQLRAHDQRHSRETSIAPGPKHNFQGAEHRNIENYLLTSRILLPQSFTEYTRSFTEFF